MSRQRCLFEARGEPVCGPLPVAPGRHEPRVLAVLSERRLQQQSIKTANRHLACQFTFACDGAPITVVSPPRGCARSASPRTCSTTTNWDAGWRNPPLSRLLGAPELGRRNEEDVQAWRAYLLSPAHMGRRLRRADTGHDAKTTEEEAKDVIVLKTRCEPCAG